MAFDTLKVVIAPDPVLETPCEECDLSDKSLRKLAKQMAKTMYKNNGCGLAAPQVGVSKRLVVIDCDQDDDEQNPIVMVNPVIVETRGRLVTEEEGCLSFPGISVPITRHEYAVARYFDLDGEEWQIEGDGLLGRCLQHEINHLDGKTMLDVCELSARIKAISDFEEAKKAGAKPGETSVK